MMRAIVGAALFAWAGLTWAQAPALRIQFVVTPDALAYIVRKNQDVQMFVQQQVDAVNKQLAASSIPGRIEVADAYQYNCCKNWLTGRPSTSLAETTENMVTDYQLAVREHLANADMTIAFTEFPDTGGAGADITRRWVNGDPQKTLENSVAAVNASASDLYNKLAHALGHALGAGHQSSGGFEDDTNPGPAHGWWIKHGSTQKDCEVAYTIMADSVSPLIPVRCNAWLMGQYTPARPTCDPADWCQQRAQMLDGSPAFYWFTVGTFVGRLVGEGEGLSCRVEAMIANTGPWLAEQVLMGAGTEMQFDMACNNTKALKIFSNPNLDYGGGVKMGTVEFANNAGVIATNLPIKAQSRYMRRDQLVLSLIRNKLLMMTGQ